MLDLQDFLREHDHQGDSDPILAGLSRTSGDRYKLDLGDANLNVSVSSRQAVMFQRLKIWLDDSKGKDYEGLTDEDKGAYLDKLYSFIEEYTNSKLSILSSIRAILSKNAHLINCPEGWLRVAFASAMIGNLSNPTPTENNKSSRRQDGRNESRHTKGRHKGRDDTVEMPKINLRNESFFYLIKAVEAAFWFESKNREVINMIRRNCVNLPPEIMADIIGRINNVGFLKDIFSFENWEDFTTLVASPKQDDFLKACDMMDSYWKDLSESEQENGNNSFVQKFSFFVYGIMVAINIANQDVTSNVGPIEKLSTVIIEKSDLNRFMVKYIRMKTEIFLSIVNRKTVENAHITPIDISSIIYMIYYSTIFTDTFESIIKKLKQLGLKTNYVDGLSQLYAIAYKGRNGGLIKDEVLLHDLSESTEEERTAFIHKVCAINNAHKEDESDEEFNTRISEQIELVSNVSKYVCGPNMRGQYTIEDNLPAGINGITIYSSAASILTFYITGIDPLDVMVLDINYIGEIITLPEGAEVYRESLEKMLRKVLRDYISREDNKRGIKNGGQNARISMSVLSQIPHRIPPNPNKRRHNEDVTGSKANEEASPNSASEAQTLRGRRITFNVEAKWLSLVSKVPEISRKLEQFANNNNKGEKYKESLGDMDLFKIRVGDLRVIIYYEERGPDLIGHVVDIAHRGVAYRTSNKERIRQAVQKLKAEIESKANNASRNK